VDTIQIAVSNWDPAEPDLLAQLHGHSRRLIETELRRLSRRAPALDPADLDVIGRALEDLADSLILDRLRNAPSDTAPLLRLLFGAAAEVERAS